MNELDLFTAAIAMTDPGKRHAWLDQHCAGNPALRARLDELVAAHFHANPLPPAEATGSFAAPVEAATESFRPTSEATGMVIAGRYKLLQQIGEGGMGSVWMADQTEPVKRRVAVKLIRVERGQSKTILSRFDAERQAIALMDHPHIAKLLDAGTTATGAPYFIMELVKGIPLNDYCDTHKLSIPERLTLFMQICAAVQHAHQKGIIHRDLKPSNILVESHDGKPVPKVIDFGLAKATTGLKLTEHTLFTGFGGVLGTPLYMAPEQASFNAVDVDTRADIYALGVILYELLTGTTPLTREAIKQAHLDEMLRLIREQEAPTPSSRLSTSDSKPSIAANRQTEPAKLGRFVKGELDWIVLKALAKERERRYETASGFAKDVERFLNHEPVSAGPVSAGYRLKKFVQRNRGQVIAASLVLLALLAGIAGTSWGFYREAQRAEGERQAKLDADAKRQEAERLQHRAEAGEKLAGERLVQVEEEKKVAAAVTSFLQYKLLAQADVQYQARRLLDLGIDLGELRENPTIKELLDRAARELTPERIEQNFPGQRRLQAELLKTVGDSYAAVGEHEKAIPLLTRSFDLFREDLGLENARTLRVIGMLALAYEIAGNTAKSIELHETDYTVSKRALGPDHPDTLTSMSNLGISYQRSRQLHKAIPLLEEALRRRTAVHGPDHENTLNSQFRLAEGYHHAGQLDRAVSLFEEAHHKLQATVGAEHPQTYLCMAGLANSYVSNGKLHEGIRLHEEVVKYVVEKYGPVHRNTRVARNDLAFAYTYAGHYDRALALTEEQYQLEADRKGPNHPDTISVLYALTRLSRDAGQPARVVPRLEQALAALRDKLGPDHERTLTCMSQLAFCYFQRNDERGSARGLALVEECHRRTRARYGPEDKQTWLSQQRLAMAYRGTNQHAQALPLLEEAYARLKVLLGRERHDTLVVMNNLAQCYMALKSIDKALPLFEEELQIRKHRHGPLDPHTLTCMLNLADTYRTAGKLDQALPLFEETFALSRRTLGADNRKTLTAMNQLAAFYRSTGKLDKALPLFEEQLQITRAKYGPEHPETLLRMNGLATTYWTLGRLDRSLPLFEQTLALQEKVLGRDHPDTQRTVVNVGVNYKDSGQVEKGLPFLEEAYRHSRKLPELRWITPQLLDGYAKAGRQAETKALANEMVADARQKYPAGGLALDSTLAVCARAFVEIGSFTDAEPLLRECLACLEKTQPTARGTFQAHANLGTALLGQKKYADAEPHLLKAYEGLKVLEKTLSAQTRGSLPETLDRLIELYTVTNKPDEVKKWQAERAQYPQTPAPKPPVKQ